MDASGTPKCCDSFFTSSRFAFPRSGCDFIDIAISSPATDIWPSGLKRTVTKYLTTGHGYRRELLKYRTIMHKALYKEMRAF
jgi:hypothetical protein